MHAVFLAGLALVGCTAATAPPPSAAGHPPPVTATARPPAAPVVYACETGDKLTVSFTEDGAKVVDQQGRTFHLAQQETGSGTRRTSGMRP